MFNNGRKGRPSKNIETISVAPALFCTNSFRLHNSLLCSWIRISKKCFCSSGRSAVICDVLCVCDNSGGDSVYSFWWYWIAKINQWQKAFKAFRKGGIK